MMLRKGFLFSLQERYIQYVTLSLHSDLSGPTNDFFSRQLKVWICLHIIYKDVMPLYMRRKVYKETFYHLNLYPSKLSFLNIYRLSSVRT